MARGGTIRYCARHSAENRGKCISCRKDSAGGAVVRFCQTCERNGGSCPECQMRLIPNQVSEVAHFCRSCAPTNGSQCFLCHKNL